MSGGGGGTEAGRRGGGRGGDVEVTGRGRTGIGRDRAGLCAEVVGWKPTLRLIKAH